MPSQRLVVLIAAGVLLSVFPRVAVADPATDASTAPGAGSWINVDPQTGKRMPVPSTGVGVTLPADPAFSTSVTLKQFRKQYTFLAPTSYEKNFADIMVPDGATVTLDGSALAAAGEPLSAGWTLHRVPLDNSGDGSHKLEADQAVGLQVMGFGHATSYQYPGGLNLELIADRHPDGLVPGWKGR